MIAIKNMKMPDKCANCKFRNIYTSCGITTRQECYITRFMLSDEDLYLKRHKDCPLAEIVTCENCNEHGIDKKHPNIDGTRYCSTLHTYTGYDFYCGDGERIDA